MWTKIGRFLQSLEFVIFLKILYAPSAPWQVSPLFAAFIQVRLLLGSYSSFFLRHQEQIFTKYPRKWRQNCLFMFPLEWKKRSEIQITIGTFQFLIGYLEFLSLSWNLLPNRHNLLHNRAYFRAKMTFECIAICLNVR